MLRSIGLAAVLAACQLCAAAAGAGGAGGVVTIAEGKSSGIRALGRIQVAEGVRVQPDDLLQTGKDGFLRIEFEDGATLDLGPETSVEFGSPSQRRADRPALYLLSGWVKLLAAPVAGSTAGLASPHFDLADISGSVVARVDQAAGSVFVEQGAARWIDRRRRGSPVVALKRNDFLAFRRDDAVALTLRPGDEFLSALPRQFRDLIPQRYAAFRGREKAARVEGGFAYADVESWINAEAPIRRQFIRTWRAKADDAAFRASLDQSMTLHPEWDRVLHPELYEPKPKPQPESASASAPAPAPAADAAAVPVAAASMEKK